MSVVRVSLDAVPEMVASGQIADAKSIIGLYLARDLLAGQARAGTG